MSALVLISATSSGDGGTSAVDISAATSGRHQPMRRYAHPASHARSHGHPAGPGLRTDRPRGGPASFGLGGLRAGTTTGSVESGYRQAQQHQRRRSGPRPGRRAARPVDLGHDRHLPGAGHPGQRQGRRRPTVPIASGAFNASDPDAVATPRGLDVFWNEVSSSSPGGTTGVFEATRPLKGGSWKLGKVTSTTSV